MDSSVLSGIPRRRLTRRRAAEACMACRSRKVRCDTMIGQTGCVRCSLDGLKCVMSKRKLWQTRMRKQPATPNATAERDPHDPLDDTQSDHDRSNNTLLPFGLIYREEDTLSPSYQSEIESPSAAEDALPARDWSTIQHAEDFPSPIQFAEPSTSYPFLSFPGTCNISHLPREDMAYLITKGVFKLPPKSVQDKLVQSYFLHIHPVLPVMREGRFWAEYEKSLPNTSLLVYRAMLFAASPYISDETLREWGQDSASETVEHLYRQARLLFDFDTESDKFALAQAALLLSYWCPRLGSAVSRRGKYWLGGAIGLAEELKARYATSSAGSRHAEERKLVDQIWWSCVVRDMSIAVGYRDAPLVQLKSLDVPFLDPEEMEDDVTSKVYSSDMRKVLARMFVSLTKLARLANVVFSTSLSSNFHPVSGTQSVFDSLFEIERTSKELMIWEQSFLLDLARLNCKTFDPMVVLHRNLALMFYNFLTIRLNQSFKGLFTNNSTSSDVIEAVNPSCERVTRAATKIHSLVMEIVDLGVASHFPAVVSSIVATSAPIHALSRSLVLHKQSMNKELLHIYFHLLEGQQKRFPAVCDANVVLNATISFTKVELAARQRVESMTRETGRTLNVVVGKGLEKDVHKASIILRTMYFVDVSFSNGGLTSNDS